MVDIRKYENDEQVLKDLIETNIRQRGVGNPNPIKLGRCIKELEKIYGVREGRPEKLPKVSAVTQEQLSDMIGISVDTLQNYKKLTELIPELEDLVETGILAPTTATALVKRMTPSEQEDFVKSMDITQKITQKQVQQYINEIKQLKENPPIPSDYNSTKRELLDYKNDYNNLKSQFNEKVLELQELRKQIENMKVTEPTEQYNKKLKDSTIFFCSKVADFIEKVGGYVWLSDHLNELPDYERKSYVNAVKTIYAWAENLLSNIND